jgi:hypothetical protein
MDKPVAIGTNQQTEPSAGRGFSWLWVTGASVMFYVLSVGPAAKLAEHRPAALPTLEKVYAPLQALCDACGPLDDAVEWYVVDLWKASL